jgi:AcrR family transcriptional regulator
MTTVFKSKSALKAHLILQAAEKLFCDLGFADTSMDAIAKEAGVSKQTVYSHFGTKNDLFSAAISAKCDVYQINEEIFQQNLPIKDTLLEFGRRFHKMILSEEAISIYRTCVSQSNSHPELGQLFYQAGPQRISMLLGEYLQDQVRIGRLTIDNIENACFQLLLMLMSRQKLQLDLGVTPHNIDVSAYIENCITLFLNYYEK